MSDKKKKRKYDYYEAFNNQIDIALEEIDLLFDVIENFTTAADIQAVLPKVHKLERKSDEINHETFTAIATDFMPPMDRNDILQIAQSMDDIVDQIEDVIRQFYVCDVHFMHKDAIEMAKVMRLCCEALQSAMRLFGASKKHGKLREALVQVNSFEEEADSLYDDFVHDLYTVDRDNPLRVVVWSHIFRRMEESTDACEHVADVISDVVVKSM